LGYGWLWFGDQFHPGQGLPAHWVCAAVHKLLGKQDGEHLSIQQTWQR
jgi:hypothetical protein